MESVVTLFNQSYKNKKVLVTGHTGFKGSWLVKWLDMLGADVFGISLAEQVSKPNHFDQLKFKNLKSINVDIRDKTSLIEKIDEIRPNVVFHLAAQSLVRKSYHDPSLTYETNLMGTINLYESIRVLDYPCLIINVTSDKAYENIEKNYAYKETDRMGGHDPYSASKGANELISASYQNSFFNQSSRVKLVNVRAGNVIGGGDWSDDRLIPDLMKSFINKEKTVIRNPNAVRPWQHVLDPLSGYLLIGQSLIEGRETDNSWNFGPDKSYTVQEVILGLQEHLELTVKVEKDDVLHEANLLMLDCSKAKNKLSWMPVWGFEKTVGATALWYQKHTEGDTEEYSSKQIEEYCIDAKNKNLIWTQ